MPILDHRIVEFAYSLPPAMKVCGSETKRILRRILKRNVPEALFERPKQGFGAPMVPWIRGPLQAWAGDLMSTESIVLREVLEPNAARSTHRRLRSGKFDRLDFRRIALAAWCDAHL